METEWSQLVEFVIREYVSFDDEIEEMWALLKSDDDYFNLHSQWTEGMSEADVRTGLRRILNDRGK